MFFSQLKFITIFLTRLCLIFPFFSYAQGQIENPFIVNEEAQSQYFISTMDIAIKEGIAPTGLKLLEQAIMKDGEKITIPAKKARNSFSYNRIKNSIAIICSVYKCNTCDSWHRGGVSTAWVAAQSGILVTNFHVINSASERTGLGVWFSDGKCYPIIEVLASSQRNDIAIIKINATGLTPLSLANPAEVGTPISVISHPDGNSYYMTQGIIARYFSRPYSEHNIAPYVVGQGSKDEAHTQKDKASSITTNQHIWMNITAAFAKGSSGAPVMDSRGRVVGMVASTQSLYSGEARRSVSSEGNNTEPYVYQMSIRNCVPIKAIKEILITP